MLSFRAIFIQSTRQVLGYVHPDPPCEFAVICIQFLLRRCSVVVTINTGICTARPHGPIGRRAAWHGAMGRAAQAWPVGHRQTVSHRAHGPGTKSDHFN